MQRKRRDHAVGRSGNQSHISKVTKLLSSHHLKHSLWQKNQTDGTRHPGPVNVYWFTDIYLFASAKFRLCISGVCMETIWGSWYFI